MKRVVMAVLMFGIASCAVDSAPAPTSTPADESAELTSAETTTSTMDRDAEPHATTCNGGTCETLAQCRAEGGIAHGPCIFPGTICCE